MIDHDENVRAWEEELARRQSAAEGARLRWEAAGEDYFRLQGVVNDVVDGLREAIRARDEARKEAADGDGWITARR